MLKDQSQQHWIPQDETSDGPCSANGVLRLSLSFRIKPISDHDRIMELEEATVKQIHFPLYQKTRKLLYWEAKMLLNYPFLLFDTL